MIRNSRRVKTAALAVLPSVGLSMTGGTHGELLLESGIW